MIYPVLVMPITNDAGRNIGGENALTTMAGGTGGRVFVPTLGAALDQAFSDIIKDLRTQYLLGYYPEKRAPHQGPLPSPGGARAATRFAGNGAQWLLWGSRG